MIKKTKIVAIASLLAIVASTQVHAKRITGSAGDDELFGTGDADTMYSWRGNDFMAGQNGNDVLYGGQGNDVLKGGWGTDKLWGQSGNDHLDGDNGYNTLGGGNGYDTCYDIELVEDLSPDADPGTYYYNEKFSSCELLRTPSYESDNN